MGSLSTITPSISKITVSIVLIFYKLCLKFTKNKLMYAGYVISRLSGSSGAPGNRSPNDDVRFVFMAADRTGSQFRFLGGSEYIWEGAQKVCLEVYKEVAVGV